MIATYITLLMACLAVYCFIRLILPTSWPWFIKVGIGLLLLACAEKLLLTRMVSDATGTFMSVPVAVGTGFLQGVAIMLFFLVLTRDVIKAGLWLARSRKLSPATGPLPRAKANREALLLLAGACLLAAWSVEQAVRVPPVKEHIVEMTSLPATLCGFRIVQLSDLHIGPISRHEWLEQVVQKVNALQPDVVVITGDSIDASPSRLARDIAPLQNLKATHGVYLVLGNHEYYVETNAWIQHFRQLGLHVLLNDYTAINVQGEPLVLAGVTDPAAKGRNLPPPAPKQVMDAVFKAYGPDITTILLAHNPSTANINAKAGVKLQLSGHTHGGHLLPLAPLVQHFNHGFVNGLYQVDAMQLYVNPGTGLWAGFPMRLGVPSEITLLILTTNTISS